MENGNLHSQIAESSLGSRATSRTVPGYRAIELSRGLFSVIGQINLAIPDGGSTDVRALSLSFSRFSSLFLSSLRRLDSLVHSSSLCLDRRLAISRHQRACNRLEGERIGRPRDGERERSESEEEKKDGAKI